LRLDKIYTTFLKFCLHRTNTYNSVANDKHNHTNFESFKSKLRNNVSLSATQVQGRHAFALQ
jgi:hypothetical protein